MSTSISIHGVNFDIDTSDWSCESSAQAAEDAMIEGLQNLSVEEINIVAQAWVDAESECNSRNADDEAANIVETIESDARDIAMADWQSFPDTGHNTFISVSYD